MKTRTKLSTILLFNLILCLSSYILYSCKSTDDMKVVVGDGKTDSDLSQKVHVTTISLKVPLSELGEDKYQIMIGGYSTSVLPIDSNSSSYETCTTRPETEEQFDSESGRLSDISLNSACKSGYKIAVNLFCKKLNSSSRTKCYSGSMNISYSQIKSTSNLNLNMDLYKTVISVEGPDSISVIGELNHETIDVELVGVIDTSTDESEDIKDIQIQEEKPDTNSSTNTNNVTSSKKDINYFINPSCLSSILKHLKYSQKICNSSPLRVSSDFSLECNYYKDNPMLYPSVARFKSVSVDGKVYYPVNTQELAYVIKELNDKLIIKYAIINQLGQETGVQFSCTWSRK